MNSHRNGELTSTLEGGSVAAEEDGTETYNCGFDDVDSGAPPSWPSSHNRLKSFQKSKHPLQIMVKRFMCKDYCVLSRCIISKLRYKLHI